MGKRFAFIVACNEYQHFRNLNFCLQDAELIKETLTKWCDYSEDDVIVEKLSKENSKTPEQIIEDLKHLINQASVGDTILFFFAGHGSGTDRDAFLILPETKKSDITRTAIRLSDVSQVLQADGLTCIRVFDACHSGVDVRDGDDDCLDYAAFSSAVRDDSTTGINWVTFASCKPDEDSFEDEDIGHGVFSLSFSNAIRGIEPNQAVEPLKLYRDIFSEVTRINTKKKRSQTPVLNNSLSGLGEFARRIEFKSPSTLEAQSQETDLMERLALFRSTEDRLICNRQDELLPIATISKKCFDQHINDLDEFYITAKVQLGNTSIIPNDLTESIVRHFKRLGVRSLHYIESYKESPHFIFRNPLEPNKTIYSVSDYQMPSSVSLMSWIGDKYIPSGKIICYVIPLETQVYTIIWLNVDSFIGSESGIVSICERYGKLEDDWASILRPGIEKAVGLCKTRVAASIRARLDYFDRERAKK